MIAALSHALHVPVIAGMSAWFFESSGTYASRHAWCAMYAPTPTVDCTSTIVNHVPDERKIWSALLPTSSAAVAHATCQRWLV